MVTIRGGSMVVAMVAAAIMGVLVGIGLTVRAVVATDEQTVLLLPLDVDEELAVAVDTALAAMSEDGRLDDLADRWLHR